MRRLRSLPLLLALLAGCGGHGGSGGRAASRVGHVSLTVAWPARSRYLPTAANLVVVKIMRGDDQVDVVRLVRKGPGNEGYSDTVENENTLLEGEYKLVANAYFESENTSPLTQGEANVTVVAGKTTNQKVIMASEIRGYRVKLTDRASGTMIGQYEITPTPTSVTATISPRMVVDVSAATLNGLVLYPPNVTGRPLSVSGDLRLGTNEGQFGSMVGALVPTTATPSSGRLTVDFKDLSGGTLLHEISADLPIAITGISPQEGAGFIGFGVNDLLASSSDGSYTVRQDASGYHLIKLLEGANYANVQDLDVLPSHLAALPGSVYYTQNNQLRRAGTARSVSAGSAYDFLAAARHTVYTGTLAGDNSLRIFRYGDEDFEVGPQTNLTTLAAPTSFAVGVAEDGKEVFYTIEAGVARRYVDGVGAEFARSGTDTFTSIAVDGNLVWVGTSSSTSYAYLASTGVRCASYSANGLHVANVSAGGGLGAVYTHNNGGGDNISIFRY